jgi:hypothetical protein
MILCEIADIHQGFPFRSRVESEAGGTVAVVQARDLGPDGEIVIEGAVRIRQRPGGAKGLLQPGDVVLQPRGTRFSAATFTDPKTTAVAAAPLLILRTEPEMVLPAFLVAFLGSPASQAFLRQAAVGTYVPQVPRQALANLHLDLPDLTSQAALVDLVCLERREVELMDRLRDARARLFDLALKDLARKDRRHAHAPGLEPSRNARPNATHAQSAGEDHG